MPAPFLVAVIVLHTRQEMRRKQETQRNRSRGWSCCVHRSERLNSASDTAGRASSTLAYPIAKRATIPPSAQTHSKNSGTTIPWAGHHRNRRGFIVGFTKPPLHLLSEVSALVTLERWRLGAPVRRRPDHITQGRDLQRQVYVNSSRPVRAVGRPPRANVEAPTPALAQAGDPEARRLTAARLLRPRQRGRAASSDPEGAARGRREGAIGAPGGRGWPAGDRAARRWPAGPLAKPVHLHSPVRPRSAASNPYPGAIGCAARWPSGRARARLGDRGGRPQHIQKRECVNVRRDGGRR